VKDLVADLLAGRLDDELVYAKRVRKRSVDDYTATTPPHVQAARKAGPRAGPMVQYLITRRGPEPVLPGVPPPAEIDYEHYVDKVIRPLADAILIHCGQRFDVALDRPRQLDLL
jgi:DNA polymerase-2